MHGSARDHQERVCEAMVACVMIRVWGWALAAAAVIMATSVGVVLAARRALCTAPMDELQSGPLDRLGSGGLSVAAVAVAVLCAVGAAVLWSQRHLQYSAAQGALDNHTSRNNEADPSQTIFQQQLGQLAQRALRPAATRALLLNLACMQLTAMASLNWALAYAIAAGITPIVLAIPSQVSGAHSSVHAVAAAGPVMLMCALIGIQLANSWPDTAGDDVLTEVACKAGSGTSYILFSSALLPCWFAEVFLSRYN